MKDRRALPAVRQRMKRRALDGAGNSACGRPNTRDVAERFVSMPGHRQRRVADEFDPVHAVAVRGTAVAVHCCGVLDQSVAPEAPEYGRWSRVGPDCSADERYTARTP